MLLLRRNLVNRRRTRTCRLRWSYSPFAFRSPCRRACVIRVLLRYYCSIVTLLRWKRIFLMRKLPLMLLTPRRVAMGRHLLRTIAPLTRPSRRLRQSGIPLIVALALDMDRRSSLNRRRQLPTLLTMTMMRRPLSLLLKAVLIHLTLTLPLLIRCRILVLAIRIRRVDARGGVTKKSLAIRRYCSRFFPSLK